MRQLLALLTVAALTQAAVSASYRTPALIAFDAAHYEVSEAATNLVVTLVRTGEFREPASCEFSLEDGTAEAGLDFGAMGGTINFRAGEGFKTFSIPVTLDGESEGAETLEIVLSNPGFNCLITQERAAVTIHDAAISLPPARLKIAPGLNQSLMISWPVNSREGVLERSANPASGVWEAVNTAPKQVGKDWTVSEPLGAANFFYRLRQ
ncbi:MAG TPA: Calx-beta domain-containing protein [Methylomirabilota bacterium]|nr:Calx-beta domain-containing protein [Methylomirabilota bacterium]